MTKRSVYRVKAIGLVLHVLFLSSCVSPKGERTQTADSTVPSARSGMIVITARSPGAPAVPPSGTVVIPADQRKAGQALTLRGRVVIVGSEPHPGVIIRGEKGAEEWPVVSPEAGKQIWNLQGYTVEFTGTLLEDGSFQPLSWKIVN